MNPPPPPPRAAAAARVPAALLAGLAVLLPLAAIEAAAMTVWSAAAADSLATVASDTAIVAPARGALARAAFHGARGMVRLSPPRVARGPVVDGALDDAVWAQAAVLDSFTHIEPVQGPPDTLGTECLVLYDERHLYIGFRCYGDPKLVRAPFLPRQEIDPSDWVGVGIDAYHDRRRMAFFLSTPLGIQADGMSAEGQEDDDALDFQYRSEGRMTEHGYEVEFAIPFRSLRFPRRDSLTFGFNASRLIPHSGVFMSWAPVSPDRGPAIAQIGALEGIAGVRPGRNVQVIPTVTTSRAAERIPDGGLRYASAQSRTGASVKVGLSSSLTADVAVTPDFSQIEADASVVDVNQRFAIFYPEKRPFFLEGREIFTTPIDVVYTRRIDDPRVGGKITGTEGRTAIGVLVASDRSAGASVPTLPDARNPYAGRDALFDIVRIRQDVGKHSTLGLLAGSREQRDSYNRGAGIDGRFVFRELWTVSGQALRSWARARDYRGAIAALTPAEDAGLDGALRADSGQVREGEAWTLALSRASRGLDASVSLLDISPGFSADMGFVPRTDQIQLAAAVEPHVFATGSSWFQSIHPELSYHRIHRHGAARHVGPRTDDELGAELVVALPRASEIGGGYYRVYTLHEGRAFPDQDRVALWASSNRFAVVQAEVFASYGDDVVFDESVAGRSLRWEVESDVRPTPQIAASVEVAGLHLTRRETGTRFVDAVIPRLRASYQHNRELSLRVIGEIDAERRYDPAGLRVPSQARTSFDVLLAYLVRPETVCYLGYGSRLAGDAVAASRPEQTSVFLKLSYLWQP